MMVNRNSNKIQIGLCLIIVAFFIAIVDCLSVLYIYPYSGDFENYFLQFSGEGGERFEVGYRIIVSFFNFMLGTDKNSFLVFLFVVSFVTVFLKSFVVFSLNQKGVFLFLCVYFIYPFLLHEANQVRISIGVSFGVLFFLFLSQNRMFLSFFALLIGCFFHASIIIFAIAYIIRFAIFRRKILAFYLISVVLLVVVYNLFDPLLFSGINPLMSKYSVFNLEYTFNRPYLFSLVMLALLGAINYRHASMFGKVAYHSFVVIFLLALSLSGVPIVAVRVMDIANVISFFYVFSFCFSIKARVAFLYVNLAFISIARFLVFMYTDTIYNFP